MCGITGIVALNEKGLPSLSKIHDATQCLTKRGPDAQGTFIHNHVALGHTRLSIIDTSEAASQPMTDESVRYTIIFNGEFFNFKEHRQFVLDKGYKLKSQSDTEVLLYLYIIEEEKCLARVNGFFSFAIYDKQEETLFIARDRMGVKPLLIYQDDNNLMFASEMKSLLAMGIPREMDKTSLFTYLQLNYIPAPHSIFKGVKKLEPGYFLKLKVANGHLETKKYYTIPYSAPTTSLNYIEQQQELIKLMDASVQLRLISDVPLGAFLSGGIDSSVVVALAAKHTKNLNTFSIGFRNEPLYDETHYANLVAKKCNTNHTVFSLTNDDLFNNLFDALDYIDEPFADSSALNVHILSMLTRKKVKVALSGDGADELFGGYNKHAAEIKARNGGITASLIKVMNPVWNVLNQSRNSKTGNKIRQLKKFAEGITLTAKDRYWLWASFMEENEANILLKENASSRNQMLQEFIARKMTILKFIHKDGDMNEVFYTDINLVLANDMLTKVDSMSMANSLEVRSPFLDYNVVDFAFSLPVNSKIDKHGRKKVVRDAFRSYLPEELYNRPKQGFEVPLLKWMNNELESLITDDLLSDKFIIEQDIFTIEAIHKLKKKLFGNNRGDAAMNTWTLIVFQYWWKKYFK